MEASHHFILLILLIASSFLIQGLLATSSENEILSLEKQLEIMNKPARKSFTTRYGDILDCIDINKQYAFDHPLLKNHSIQMKPTFARRSSLSMTSEYFLPKHMICPQGTVPIRRIQKEDLLTKKFTPIFSSIFNNVSKGVSNSVNGHDGAGIVAIFKNLGASATLNVWNPKLKPGQYSTASVYVGSEDGPLSNVVQSGWMVSPVIYPNSYETRFFAYWTKDSGKTGCYNTACPGFVQVSKTVSLGQVISPTSKRLSTEKFIDVQIRQDILTKNWWLTFNNENVGYWPAALFTTLKASATRAGWGGDVYSPPNMGLPEMGSGFKAKQTGYLEVSYMKNLQMLAPELFPKREELFFGMSSPDRYNVIYNYDSSWQNSIYFGGPKNL